jgi:pyridoxine 5'-phosphate synthase PdxJ
MAQGTQFTTSATQTTTQTFDVAQNALGYTGKHDEHLSPVVALLHSLKDKLRNSKKITADRVENLTGEYKKAEKAAEIVSSLLASRTCEGFVTCHF